MNLEFVRPFIKYIPEVTIPKRHVAFKEKLNWTLLVLALFFIMGNLSPIGVDMVQDLPVNYQQFAMIFASNMGSILSVGIGPIVTASIVLQLLVGSKMIDIDLSSNDGKALFQAAQKLLTVLIAIFEAAAIVIGFKLGHVYLQNNGLEWSLSNPVVMGAIFQIALGSIILMFLDEIVSKWGIGSGIGLFIAGGVSLTIITNTFSILPWIDPGRFKELGIIPDVLAQLASGSSDPSALMIMLFPVLSTIIVFLVIVYLESMRLEIPLSYGGVRGVGGRYPIKFFYVSNIPVILAAALLANVQMFPAFVGVTGSSTSADLNDLQRGVVTVVNYITQGELGGSREHPGILNPANIYMLLNFQDYTVFLHLITYTIIFLLLCVLFGKFWVETTGLGADQVADQIQKGGMQIPGFRRDKRVVTKVLNRYIPQITIISSVAVGLLAVGADYLGAIGSGTGILLTVGILYRFYEEIQKEQMADMGPMFRKFMGKK